VIVRTNAHAPRHGSPGMAPSRWGVGTWWARPGSLIGVVVLSAVLGASCGPAGPEPTASPTEQAQQAGSPAAQRLVLLMDEFSFTVAGPPPPPGYPPQTAVLPGGRSVLVTLRNVGRIVHHWSVGRTLLPGGGYEDDLLAMMKPEVLSGAGYRLVQTEEGTAGGPGGLIIEVAPGGAVTLRLAVPADATGTWEMACFVPGHYQAGMRKALTIK
jgi:uncharacterized cupredoxin-like copper-binding protein